ncbi:MAG TPA: hypothetical protein VGC54_13685 [Planctomycetota bacterium]
MNGRQTLMLLGILVVAAAIGRWWVSSQLDQNTVACSAGRKQLETVYTMVDELSDRLASSNVSKDESAVLRHFQERAIDAYMGTVNPKTRTSPQRTYLDRIYTIDFEKEAPEFKRTQIVNFLWNAELVPRMRCTTLVLRPASPGDNRRRQLPAGAERPDVWQIEELIFTQRSPVEAAGRPAGS